MTHSIHTFVHFVGYQCVLGDNTINRVNFHKSVEVIQTPSQVERDTVDTSSI
jgi:hypothetical protein